MPHFTRCEKTGHARIKLHCSDSDEDFDVAIPWEHRYDPIGWSGLARVRWQGGSGIEVDRGPQGIMVVDERGQHHPLRHGTYTIDGTKEPEKPKKTALQKLTGVVRKLRKAKTRPDKLKGKKDHPPPPPGSRWITVHPNGHDEKGVPVLITPSGDGSWRIIGGAGGKLNHTRLTGVKSESEYKEQAKEKAKKKRADRKALLGAMSPDERQAFKAQEKAKKAELNRSQRKLVEKVRDKLGGVDEDLTEEDLKGLDEKGRAKLEAAHHRRQWRQANKQRLRAARELADETVAREEDREAVEKATEDIAENDPKVHAIASQEAERVIEEEEARRMLKDSRAKPETLRMARAARKEAAETSGAYLEEKVDLKEAFETYAGSAERPMAASAVEELTQRAEEARAQARILHEAAKGEDISELDPKVQETYMQAVRGALERAGVSSDASDEELAEALQLEAGHLVHQAQMDQLAARNMGALPPAVAAKALAAKDAVSGLSKQVREHVERLGLRERDRTPLRDAEIAEIHEVLGDFASFRKLKEEFADMVEQAESDDYDKSRRAFDLDVGPPPESIVEEVEERILRDLATRLTGVAAPSRLSHTQAVSGGHYMKLADISLGIDDRRHLDRSVVEAIGLRNASHLLSHALQKNGHDPKDLLDTMERLHIKEQKKLTTEALQAADDFAPGIEEAVQGVDDIEAALQAMDVADEDINEAERMVGAALGQLEANATFAQALREDMPNEFRVKYDDNSTTWLAVAGLTPDDYQLHGEGKNREVVIPKSSWDKLLHETPAKVVEQRKLANAIKRGSQDEEGWLPQGMVSRTATTFNDGPLEMARIAEPLNLNEVGGDIEGALAQHIGRRVADGERPDDIERELRSRTNVPDGYMDAVQKLMPKTKAGDVEQRAENKRIQSERERLNGAYKEALASDNPELAAEHLQAMQDLPEPKVVPPRTDADFRDHYGELARKATEGGDRSPMHSQSLYDDGITQDQVKEVAFRAMMEHPAAVSAFKPIGELDHRDFGALRDVFYGESKADRETGWKAEFDEQLATLMDETKEPSSAPPAGGGLFGGGGGGGGLFGAGGPAPVASKADEPMTPERFATEHPEKVMELVRQYPREGEHLFKAALGERPAEPTDEQLARLPDNVRRLADAIHEQHPRLSGPELADRIKEESGRLLVMKERGVSAAAFDERDPDTGELSHRAQSLRANAEMQGRGVKGVRADDLHAVYGARRWDAQQRSFDNLKARVGTPWAQFVDLHGGQAQAYQALQDVTRSKFLQSYRKHHGRITGKELRGGITDITGRETHVQAMASPQESKDVRAARRKEIDAARTRQKKGQLSETGQNIGDRFASGSAIAAAAEERKRATEMDQRQGSMDSMFRGGGGGGGLFGGGNDMFATQRTYDTIDPVAPRTEPLAGERTTIGERAEQELGSMMRMIGHQVDPRQAGNADALFPGASMDGGRVDQQRAIKMLKNNGGRLLMAFGTGSGKTPTGIGAFTDLRESGATKKGLFLVPKAVEGQFASEMNVFTEPGRYHWETGDGKGHQGRVDAMRSGGPDMAVLTHQAATNTLSRILADHEGKAREVVMSEFRQLGTKERAQKLRAALDAAGIPRSFVNVDESHMLTTREGAQESDAAMLIGALAHPDNATHLLLGSATPMKNDLSEVFSTASLLDPDTYSDRAKFMRQFGDGSIEAPDAIRRELGHMIHTARIDPKGVTRNDIACPRIVDGKKVAGGPLPLKPEHQKLVDAVQDNYQKAKAAWARGTADVDAIKALAPHRFEGRPEGEHQSIAEQVATEGLGSQLRNATRKAVDQAPFEHNTKFHAILDVIRHDLKQEWTDIKGKARNGKRPLLFVDSAATADHLAAFLKEQGLEAGVYSGRMNTDERNAWKEGYNSGAMHVGILTAAGEAGINITSANSVHHVDVPLTAKSHTQRTGRAFRQRQLGNVDVHDWSTDTDFERNEMRRLNRKGRLAQVYETPLGPLDEHGVAAEHQETLAAKHASFDAESRMPLAAK